MMHPDLPLHHQQHHTRTREFALSQVVACHATFISLLALVIGLMQMEYQSRPESPFQTHLKSMRIFLTAICIYGLSAMFQFAQLASNYSRFVSYLVLISGLLSAMSLLSIFVPNRLHYMIWVVFCVTVVGLVTWDLFRLSQWLYRKITTAILNLLTSWKGLGLELEQELGHIEV